MSRRWKIATWIAGGLVAVLLVLAVTAFLVVRSHWFYEMVRNRLIGEVEKATGGRVEIRSYALDWRTLRAQVHGFIIHGTEPPGSPPLFQAGSVTVGLRVVSVVKRMVDIASLDVVDPRVYLIVYPDGRTNVPEPKIKRPRDRTAMETILDLAIGRFTIQNGVIEVAEKKTPLNARGENLRAQFSYSLLGPRYKGEVSIHPLQVKLGPNTQAPLDLNLAVELEKNRIKVNDAKLLSGKSQAQISGAVDDLVNLRGSFQYDVRLLLDELGRTLRLRSHQQGVVNIGGNARFAGLSDYLVTGNLHASGLAFRQGAFQVRAGVADSALSVRPDKIDLRGTRISALLEKFRIDGRLEEIALATKTGHVDVNGIRISALGGSFTGRGWMEKFNRFQVQAELSGFDIKQLVGLYSREPAPWDGIISGPVRAQGSLKASRDLRAAARLSISPAPQGPAVRGLIDASYEARRNILDLSRSYVALPSTRLDFSGALGGQLRVRAESKDLRDLLPLTGALPVELRNGAAVFDGTVTGQLESPRIAGHVAVTRFACNQEVFDSLNADVKMQESNAAVEHGSLARGKLQSQFEGSVSLRKWKPYEAGAVSASASIRNADIAELAAMAGQKQLPVSGTLAASAQVSGTVGNPVIAGDLTASQGAIYEEPFDRLHVKMNSTDRLSEISSAQLIAGANQITLKASFEHPREDFRSGRLRFQVASNPMALEQIQIVQKNRPGAKGTLQMDAAGAATITKSEFQLNDLNASVVARKVEVEKKAVGDIRLAAATQGDSLQAKLDSDFANSVIHGEGRWRLAGDYPGSAEVTFSRLDFSNLRAWLAPRKSPEEADISGFAEGRLTMAGPALKPEAWKAALEIPKFELTPKMEGRHPDLTIRNSGPIRMAMQNSVVRAESVRFVARSTDLSISGTVSLKQKNALDLRVNGRADLGMLQSFNRDLVSSGLVTSDTSIRGALDQPQITGKLDLKDAAFNMLDVPNGVSNVNGTILFDGSRANIQKVTADSGGGKIAITGFIGFTPELLFRLQANATQVRVRYPEGASTVANAALNLTGSTDRSTLAGAITILRTGFNPHADFSSMLARTAEPVQTPSARTGWLNNMQFDVQIETAPDISFQSALAQDLQAEANLRLRGNPYNPALLGRVNITGGEVVFFGTQFSINQGSIAFYNPVKIEPVLNVDLETKARGIDVILTLTGPITKLNVSQRSDPPLPFAEIIALLATGRTPTSDPTMAARQAAQPQTWQQMGASALVGQAIANPVAGRLQRFFGVSKLKIDPSFTGTGGVESNPQARLTLEQQVTRDLTFTYITNVASGNPQVIRIEWSFSKQWSAIALREENGLFGLDFLYKKRFK